jgi:dGTPase
MNELDATGALPTGGNVERVDVDAAAAVIAQMELDDSIRTTVNARGAERGGLVFAHRDSTGHVGSTRVQTRDEREAAMETRLAPGAARSQGAGDRVHAEEPDPVRTCFEKDADRIRYSTAFRRLAGKCQVFVAPKNDHLRNRLTHALETAQVALSVARVVGLNEHLVEAIAIGHDCGHGPTGHSCEEALSMYLPGGFDHAPYGADVTLLGLNLCSETLDGIRNHSWKRPAPKTAEGELVSISDRISYVCHDFADARVAGIVSGNDLPEIVRAHAGETHSDQIGYFVSRLAASIATHGRVALDEEAAAVLDAFRVANFERIYLRPASMEQARRSVRLLRAVCEHFIDMPGQIPDVVDGVIDHPGAGSEEAAVLAVRYVSGMTDRYAIHLGVERLGLHPSDLPKGV